METIGKIGCFFCTCAVIGLLIGVVVSGGRGPETVRERDAAVMQFGKKTQFIAYSDEDRAWLDGLIEGVDR